MITEQQLASVGFILDEECNDYTITIRDIGEEDDNLCVCFDIDQQKAYLEEYEHRGRASQLICLGDRWDLELLVRLITILRISTGNSPL